ncbi:hypothetical protein PHSY_000002 [Pseudozyma hubeiensis SY62]|uniref:Uncharacterized protein n=1 Tax=Pseudozyma hubeiensis (strain SY62) TaxID=1305764 RepID=R9NVJ3_PSEHS|nr:hypothetical protein PHSY_000002 [Pseudozyma hubeiensis SY62]GAC92449.1 hypothetical protein PHSY_000002 [Pseudozyma hubeiensis SY62]
MSSHAQSVSLRQRTPSLPAALTFQKMTTSSTDSTSPPPYTPIAAPLANDDTPSTSASPTSPRSVIATPLPSYSSSPVLRPSSSQPPPPLSASAEDESIKLGQPSVTLINPPACAEQNLTSHAHSSSSKTFAAIIIALLGPTIVDTAWLTLLNILGALLILAQLPMALVLAFNFNYASESSTGRKEGSKGRGKRRVGEECWVERFTGFMWDWHDALEEAELECPSRW